MTKKRPILSCHRCRSRRVRCDRRKPCTSCVRNKNAQSCSYDIDLDSYEKSITQSLDNQKVLETKPGNYWGNNPISRATDIINFHEPVDKENEKEYQFANSRLSSSLHIGHKEVSLRTLFEYLHHSEYSKANPAAVSRMNAEPIGQRDLSDDTLVQLLTDIGHNLPDLPTIDANIETFFRSIYIIVPVLDESDIREAVSRILKVLPGGFLTESVKTVNDISYMGILLVILLFVKMLSLEAFQPHLMESDPFMHLARRCIRKIDIIAEYSLPLFQFLLFYSLYLSHFPAISETEYIQKIRISAGLGFEIAYAINLAKFNNTHADDKAKNLRQKLSVILFQEDINDASIFGFFRYSKMYGSSVRLLEEDEVNEKNSNNLDVNLEKQVIKMLREKLSVLILCDKILDMILDTERQVDTGSYSLLLSRLEFEIGEGSLIDRMEAIKPTDSPTVLYTKVDDFFYSTLTISFNLYLLEHFALYFDNQQNTKLMFFYKSKIQHIIIGDILPAIVTASMKLDKIFGSLGSILVSAGILQLMYKALLLLLDTFIRLNYHIYYFDTIYSDIQDDKQLIYSLLKENIALSEKCTMVFILIMDKFATFMGAAKGVRNLMETFMKISKEDKFYNTNGDIPLKNYRYDKEFLIQSKKSFNEGYDSIDKELYEQLKSELENSNSLSGNNLKTDFEIPDMELFDFIDQWYGNDMQSIMI